MPLKTFIQHVKNGLAICPKEIRIASLKEVIAKLKGTAKDAVRSVEINTVNNLRDALKQNIPTKEKLLTEYERIKYKE